MQRGVD